jgi:hypothetical protein
MIRRMFFPGLLETGPVCDGLLAIRDGIVNTYIVQSLEGLVCFDAGFRRACVAQAFTTLGLAPRDGRRSVSNAHERFEAVPY